MTEDEKYMARCLQLARNGVLHVAPNPMVGAVIVHKGKIIGEGYHRRCGGAHAEVNAIAAVRNESLLRQSTIYVSLEPCAHFGKTPPCADLIVEKRMPRVVVGCVDPFSKVAGRGIARLQAAGVAVTTGVLEAECLALNRRFITFHQQQRPYVTLKWAQSRDGFMGIADTSYTFSNQLTQMLAHRQRTLHSAIMVGRQTAATDNPTLNVRHWCGETPLRVVLDRDLQLSPTLHLFDGTLPTLVFTAQTAASREGVSYHTLNYARPIVPQLLHALWMRGVQSLLVEGGATLLQSFIDFSMWDEAFVETAPIALTQGIAAPKLTAYPCHKEEHFGALMAHYHRIKC